MPDLPTLHLVDGKFKLFFGGSPPTAGYAVDTTSGYLFRNGELWGRVESLELGAPSRIGYVAYKRVENGEVISV